MIFAGIDPGVSGAVALVDGEWRLVAVHDMPTQTTSTGRRQVDFARLAAILREHDPDFALVEKVGPRPGEGAVGAFAFGHSYGGILAVVATLGVPHDTVQPATWKRKAGIPAGAPKQHSITVACRLLPDAAPHLTRAKDHGRAEAILLALQAVWRSGPPWTRSSRVRNGADYR